MRPGRPGPGTPRSRPPCCRPCRSTASAVASFRPRSAPSSPSAAAAPSTSCSAPAPPPPSWPQHARSGEQPHPPALMSTGGALVEVDNVVKRYGSVVALDGVSAQIEERAVGLLGANGAGKSTLMRTILGLI